MLRHYYRAGIRLATCVLLAVVCAAGQQVGTKPGPERTSLNPMVNAVPYGLLVKSIGFRGVSAEQEADLSKRIEQKMGQPLDRGKIQRSIRALYATGLLDYIAVEAKGSEDGVDLTFAVTRNYFVGAVGVVGLPKKGPNEAQLVNASNLELGEQFTDERLQAAFPLMQKVMQDNGYYRAKITAEKTVLPERQQVNIQFRVSAGRQARVGNILVEGSSGLSSKKFQEITGLHTGDEVRAQTVTKVLQKLRKRFQRETRLEAQTTLLNRKYIDASNTVEYTFSVDPGPTVEIRTDGMRLSQSTLKRYVPVYEEGAVDDDLLNEGRRNLTDYLQTLGFFDAKVSFNRIRDQQNKHVEIVYTIDRGSRHKLTRVEIEGNKYFPSSLIRERMTIQPAGWLLSHGRYSQSLLARDVNSVTDLYRTNGFSKVDVKATVKDNLDNDPEHMGVVFHVLEGPQLLVHSMTITGDKSFPKSELKDMLSTIEGQPFSEVNVAQDRDLILNYYFNRGFPSVQVKPFFEEDGPNKMDVRYEIDEGPRVFVDKVYVTGLENTRPAIVDRDISIKPGDALSQLSMLDSQRRLYDLGLFNQVDMAVQNPDGTAGKKNLLFEIKEAKRYTFNYGFGVEIGTGVNAGQGTSPQGQTGVSPRVSFDVTRLNFRGKDQSIIFKSSLGALQQRVLLTFEAPRLFDNPNLKFTISTFYDNTRDVTTFTSQRLEEATQLEHHVNKSITMLYGFSYRRVKASDFPPNFDPTSIGLNSQPVRVGIPSVAFIRDQRDDPLDSTKGNYTIANFGVASGYFGSEANFGRMFLQNSTYYTFKKKYVLARSTRFGYEAPYGSCPTCLPGQSPVVPLPERFFEGGGNSHRGFSINQAGPRDPASGTPIGGSADFINNIELRLPPMNLPWVGQNLSLVFFHDMGNVFPTADDLFSNFFRWKQKNPNSCKDTSAAGTCDFNFIAHAVGTGVRYKTPIGPVRIDFGYNLNPAVFPIKDPIAPAVSHYETIRRFNVFFSIGQTF